MKRIIFTILLIIQTSFSIFALEATGTVSLLGSYNEKNLYLITGDNITLKYRKEYFSNGLVEYGIDGVSFGEYWKVTRFQDPFINGYYFILEYSFNPSSYFKNSIELHSVDLLHFDAGGAYFFSESPTNVFTCSQVSHTIYLNSPSTQRWEKSSDNGLNWATINCTLPFYTENSPTIGTYLYRALNGDGTYSSIKQATYLEAVPSNLSITSATNIKTVDETITFSTSISDPSYNYQWYKGTSAITNATSSSYTISTIKATDADSYTCSVSNSCNSITSTETKLTVNKANQVITFPEIPIKTIGDAAFTLPATTDKGLTIFYQSTNTSVATVSGNTVTIVSPGTAYILASQNGNADYLVATGVTKTLTVNKIAQSITLNAIPAKMYGGVSFTLPVTTDKGLTISYTSTNAYVATISGNTVTILNAGSTDIIANQAGTSNYYAAPAVSQTLAVNKATQAITFTAIATKTYGDANITLAQTTDKGLAITYTSNNTNVVTVQGNVLTLINAGAATLTASQSGSSNYLTAISVSQDITVQKTSQTIVWANIANKTYGDANFTLPQTTDKGLTISYQSTDPNIAAVIGNIVSIKGVGTINITASQIGSENYNAASNVTLPLTISKAYQTITFADLPSYNYGTSPVTLSASNNSGLAVTFDSSDPIIASVSGNILTINSAGQCYITANASGDANHFSATPVQKLLKVLGGTGINDISSQNIIVYPIPANDKIFIKSDIGISKVEIYSVDGQLMQLREANDVKTVDVSALIKGAYIVRLFSDSGISTKMIIKK